MITLSLPSAEDNLFYYSHDILIGPFGPTGVSEKEDISYRHSLDYLHNGDKLYHENDVVHVKYEGTVTTTPKFKDFLASPIDGYPHAVSFRGMNLWNGETKWRTTYHGHCVPGIVFFKTGQRTYTQRIYTVANGAHCEFYQLEYDAWDPNSRAQVWFYQFVPVSNTQSKLTYKQSILTGVTNAEYVSGSFPASRMSYAEVLEACIAIRKGRATDWNTTQTAELIRMTPDGSFSPSSIKSALDSYIVANLDEKNFSIPPQHYGDLASSAAEKVNRNNVNMIAFLKDLKNPKALIPKLRNLRKLKDHAGNYLAVNYGILPTISDIQSIVKAFERVQPYIDKNGYSTYNAVHSESKSTSDTVTETSEQRIKIAIEDEDNDFIKLMNSVHSAGFAPTLENVWDLIPYSFVLDWFIDIGDFLERIDTNLSLLRLNIRYATMSHKRTLSMVVLPSENLPISGTISVVSYRRWTSYQCPMPPLSFASENTVSDHWLEASALIVQRTKH